MDELKIKKFRSYAWFTLAFCVAVILWGAFVRATGSGAGCGAHWPLCDGEVIPRLEHVQRLIEYTHRLTSGLSLIFVVILAVWAFRLFPKGSFERKASTWAVVAIFIEAALGAMLVLMRYVEMDQSQGRVLSIALHLTNTLFLLGALTITADSAGVAGARWRIPVLSERRIFRVILLGFLLLGALGAITALGDTLFRPTSLAAGWAAKWAEEAHLTERLRLWHPLLVVVWIAGVVPWMLRIKEHIPESASRVHFFLGCLGLNFLLGVVNVVLLAPVALQLLHLLGADLIWISLVLVGRIVATRWR